jgi:hypothetical protein
MSASNHGWAWSISWRSFKIDPQGYLYTPLYRTHKVQPVASDAMSFFNRGILEIDKTLFFMLSIAMVGCGHISYSGRVEDG